MAIRCYLLEASAKLPLLLVFIALVAACEKEPTTYQDCVLKHIGDGGGVSDTGARLVHKACRDKFPDFEIVDLPNKDD